MSRLEVKSGDRLVTAEIDEQGRITIDGLTFTVRPAGAGAYSVATDERQWRVVVAGPHDNRWVAIDGRVAQVEIADARRGGRRSRGSAPDALFAPMPATVVKVLVTPGAPVKQGDTLLVLEAMKMELPVRSPRDGKVRSVGCTAGELVQPGVPLLELEP